MKVFTLLGCFLSLVGVSLSCHPSNGCDDLGHGNCNTGGSSGHHGGGGHHGRTLVVDGKEPDQENAEENDDKLCADKEVIGQLCLAGTSMGDKLMAALDVCTNIEVHVDDMERRRKMPKGKGKNKGQNGNGGRGKGKGKGGRGKCPTAGEILEKINSQTSEHRCVLKQMGWVDAEGKVSLTSEVAVNDLKTLHPSVLENMAKENIQNCHKESLDQLKKTSLYKKCKNNYSEEDGAKIKEVLSNMIFGKCSKKIFMKSCSKYVAGSFMSFMEKAAIQN